MYRAGAMAGAPDAPEMPPPQALQPIKEYVLWIHDPRERIPTEDGGFKSTGAMRFLRATTPFPVPSVGDVIMLDVEVAGDSRSWEERARAKIKERRVVVRVEHHIEVKESGIVHNLNVHTKLEVRRG
jgi:hypothetical protein